MILEFDEKLSIQIMLDKLIIVKLLEQIEGSVSLPNQKLFYEKYRFDFMSYEDSFENVQLFFDYANIGDFILNPDFLSELEDEEEMDGCIFFFYLNDLERLKKYVPAEHIEAYNIRIKSIFDSVIDIDWYESTYTDLTEFIGLATPYELNWHAAIKKLVEIINEIREECKNYENSNND